MVVVGVTTAREGGKAGCRAKGSSGLAARLEREEVVAFAELAQERVLGIQRKLHRWSTDDQDRRFDALHNLVCDPATLMAARLRVRANRVSRSAGVDGKTAYHIEHVLGRAEVSGRAPRGASVRALPAPAGQGAPHTQARRETPSTWGADGHRIPQGRGGGLWIRWSSHIRSIRCAASAFRCCSFAVSVPVASTCARAGRWVAWAARGCD